MKKKAIAFGFLGSTALLLFYLAVLTLTNSFEHALEQLNSWLLMISLLVIGFGVQIGLYSYTRDYLKKIRLDAEKKNLAATGGISGTSMILCCVHHLADVVPILGFSAFALFLSEFQFAFLSMGVFSNAIGIIMILGIMQKNNLIKFNLINISSLKNPAIAMAVPIILVLFLISFLGVPTSDVSNSNNSLSLYSENQDHSKAEGESLETISKEENGLTITAAPSIKTGSIEFQLKIDTHQGTNDFDVKKSAALIVDGKTFSAERAEGFASGHHRNGKLIFTEVPESGGFSLIIKNAYEVKERVFEWELN